MLTSDGTKEGRKGRIGKVMTGRGVSVSGRKRKLAVEGRIARNVPSVKGFVVAADRLRMERRAGEGGFVARHLLGGHNA